jgi:phage tail-like protein
MTIIYRNFGDPENAPVISNWSPTGIDEDVSVDISFTVTDVNDDIVQNSIKIVVISSPIVAPIVTTVLENGVWETGWSGTVTAITNGFNVVVSTHPRFLELTYEVQVTVEDSVTLQDNRDWQFTCVEKPVLTEFKAIARKRFQATFDLPVRCKALSVRDVEPVDQWTQINWVANGGASDDANNPANYVITRPEDGNLSDKGEAVDLVAVKAYPDSEYYTDDSGYRWSTVLIIETDFHHTPRSTYQVKVSNVVADGTPEIKTGTLSTGGYIASQKVRNSLHLIDTLPSIAVQLDADYGDLEKFFIAIQEVFDRLTEDVDAFFDELCNIDHIRTDFLDLLLYEFGNPFQGLLPLTNNQKRKLLSLLVALYKEKGTCEGLINAVRILTGIQLSSCINPWDDCWVIGEGTYPTSSGGSLLGFDTYLGPTGSEAYSFVIVSPQALTTTEEQQIRTIAEYMKPAHTHLARIDTP